MVWREGKEVEQEVGNQNLSGYRTREVGGTVVKKKKCLIGFSERMTFEQSFEKCEGISQVNIWQKLF